jgi:hypothetical protein
VRTSNPTYIIYWENLQEKYHLEYIGVGVRIILTGILERENMRNWTLFIQFRTVQWQAQRSTVINCPVPLIAPDMTT